MDGAAVRPSEPLLQTLDIAEQRGVGVSVEAHIQSAKSGEGEFSALSIGDKRRLGLGCAECEQAAQGRAQGPVRHPLIFLGKQAQIPFALPEDLGLIPHQRHHARSLHGQRPALQDQIHLWP